MKFSARRAKVVGEMRLRAAWPAEAHGRCADLGPPPRAARPVYRPLRERAGRHAIDGSRSSTRATPSLSARRHAKTARPPAWRFVLVEAIRARALKLRVSRYAGVLDRPHELGWGTGWSVHAPPFARCGAHFVDDLGGSQRYVLAVRVSSRVRLRGTWRVLGRRDDLGAMEAERRLLAQWAGHGKV